MSTEDERKGAKGKNVINAINLRVVATVHHGSRIIDRNEWELDKICQKKLKSLNIHRGSHIRSSVDRLYIHQKLNWSPGRVPSYAGSARRKMKVSPIFSFRVPSYLETNTGRDIAKLGKKSTLTPVQEIWNWMWRQTVLASTRASAGEWGI